MPRHKLKLDYKEFCQLKKSLSNTIIGKYIIYDEIGRGSNACVYDAMDNKTKKPVAAKVIDLAQLKVIEKRQLAREVKTRLAKTESEMMAICDSPHILKCYDVYENEDLIVMMIEYCNEGTLT